MQVVLPNSLAEFICGLWAWLCDDTLTRLSCAGIGFWIGIMLENYRNTKTGASSDK